MYIYVPFCIITLYILSFLAKRIKTFENDLKKLRMRIYGFVVFKNFDV